eukprot:TRINITY_DN1392_c1_g1_i1.p1 TRINITY_DN1392_c1_g1~~TRINITY_DN1392_c1_g1_i1.p1  ORF type:complete len:451 (+),score=75.69 TRINITY_DN1392_c1_g1_i1:55-1407(+)
MLQQLKTARQLVLLYLLVSGHVLPVAAVRSQRQSELLQEQRAAAASNVSSASQLEVPWCSMYALKPKAYFFDFALSEKDCADDGKCMAVRLMRDTSKPLLQFWTGVRWKVRYDTKCNDPIRCRLQFIADKPNPDVVAKKVEFELDSVRSIKRLRATDEQPDRLEITGLDGNVTTLGGGLYYTEDILRRGAQYWDRASHNFVAKIDTRTDKKLAKDYVVKRRHPLTATGVVITKIDPSIENGTMAYWNLKHPEKAFHVGDIILEVGRTPIKDPHHLETLLKDNTKNVVIVHHPKPDEHVANASDLREGYQVVGGTAERVGPHTSSGMKDGISAGILFGMAGGGAFAVGVGGASAAGVGATTGYLAGQVMMGATFGAVYGLGIGFVAGGVIGTAMGIRSVMRKSSEAERDEQYVATKKIFDKLWCMTKNFKRCSCKGNCRLLVPRNQTCPES